jgi:molybdate transport system regulatory protein
MFPMSRTRFRGKGITPRFKLWLSCEKADGAFGGGKWRLLRAIHREGSLRAAASSLGISYRKAWGDLRKAERALGMTFLERHRGGADGGETRLTETGRKWVLEYGRFQDRVERAVDKAFALWLARMKK